MIWVYLAGCMIVLLDLVRDWRMARETPFAAAFLILFWPVVLGGALLLTVAAYILVPKNVRPSKDA